jgi:hypothetical protein
MIRLSSVFWVLLVSATALATFAVKYEVQTLDDRLADAKKATASEARELHVLDAEWAYLNRPEMLAAMNERFLKLASITREQLQTSITDIPMRSAPPPAPPNPATGPVAALDGGTPASASPPAPGAAATASLGTAPAEVAAPDAPPDSEPAPSDKLALAAASAGPLLVRTAAVSPAPARGRARALDDRGLDQLIARIAAGR